MRIDLDMGDAQANKINAYDPGQITINNQVYHQSVLLSPEILLNWEPNTIQELKPEHMDQLIQLVPEIVVIGTGKQPYVLDPVLLIPLQKKGIGVEVMITKSACFTYNILMSEGRKVVAALFL